MKHLPKGLETQVRRWVAQYQQARAFLDQVSQEARKKLGLLDD